MALRGGPNVSGQAYAFMAMTPVAPGKQAALRAYLEGLPRGADSPLARLECTHFARWVIVEDLVNDPDQPREDHLPCPSLIFTSNLDGPLDRYLDVLCERLAPEAGEIWGRCVGCPDGASGPALKAYLLHNQIDTGFFVAAYPTATVAKVRGALALRERMIDLAIRGQSLSSAELQQAFAEELGR
jgi:hypothetical protein